MDEIKDRKTTPETLLPIFQAGTNCCSGSSCCETGAAGTTEGETTNRILNVDLLVIDLETCARCVPTGDQLQAAVSLLTPVVRRRWESS